MLQEYEGYSLKYNKPLTSISQRSGCLPPCSYTQYTLAAHERVEQKLINYTHIALRSGDPNLKGN